MKGLWVVVVATALAWIAATAQADELLIETIQTEKQAQSERPRRGMTMERVREAYGQPQQRQPAVGDPPITRWQYESFIVYFEHDRVLHAVSRR